MFVEILLSGAPQKTSRTELLLPLPQAQRRPHGAGLEPTGPKARLLREAAETVMAGTPRGHGRKSPGTPIIQGEKSAKN